MGAVDELVGDDDVAGSDVMAEPADGARGEHLADAERPQRPEVGAVVDRVRRVLVVRAVPRQERDRATRDGADRDRRRRVAVRRLHGVLLRVVEEGVEAGAADHGDLGHR